LTSPHFYPAECVEGLFSEVRVDGVLGSSQGHRLTKMPVI
jgi:hypothetical protein